MSKFIHLFSGGLDSTVLLYELLSPAYQESKVHCLLFDYGQRHIKELGYAQETCRKLNVPYDVLVLPRQLFDKSSITGGLKKVDLSGSSTVVPNRNMVLISMAASYALSHGGTVVSYSANADDAVIYPDCRVDYVDKLNRALLVCHTRRMEVTAPYINYTKAKIVQIGLKLGVPFEETWSCYAGGNEPCGECGACKVRQDAIEKAG